MLLGYNRNPWGVVAIAVMNVIPLIGIFTNFNFFFGYGYAIYAPAMSVIGLTFCENHSQQVVNNIIFAAIVVVGDQKGRVGYGSGKATEVPDAIVKATNEAKKNMVRIPLREGRTLHHDVEGRFGAGKVVLRTAPAGTGVIAGGPMRAVFEVLGVQDVVAKSLGSNNPYNMIKATFAALESINSPRMVAAKRGKKVGDIVSRRENNSKLSAEEA